jgi:lambda family phage portal protein
MQLNLIDRAVQAVAPVWALERRIQRTKARLQLHALDSAASALGDLAQSGASASMDSGDSSSGGSPSAGRRWFSSPRDSKSDTLYLLPTQRGQSRELARTSPIAVGAINTNVDRVVGTGLALSCQPDCNILGWTQEQKDAWKKITQAEFSLWSDSTESDICNTLNFYEQQALVLRSTLESGDCFTNLPNGQSTSSQPYKLRLQVIEADRVGNEFGKIDGAGGVSGGIKFDPNGRPVACFVYDQHPGAGYSPSNGALYKGSFVDFVGASGRRRILHHLRKLRPDQPRGVPYLAPITNLVKQLKRLSDAEVEAAVISAFFTVFIEGTPAGDPAPIFDGKPAKVEKSPDDDIALGQGAIVGLAPGEKINIANPARPNPNLDAFITSMLREVGMALGIPQELLSKQFNASYSASKAALLDAWVYFRNVRTWLARSFCQPVYETWLSEAVASGRIAAPGFFTDPLMRWAYTRAAWHGDSMGSINPKDEVAAYTSAIDARLMTRERAVWELFGTDFDTDFPQMRREHEQLQEADMLPVPKAGAAAPQSAAKPADPQSKPEGTP